MVFKVVCVSVRVCACLCARMHCPTACQCLHGMMDWPCINIFAVRTRNDNIIQDKPVLVFQEKRFRLTSPFWGLMRNGNLIICSMKLIRNHRGSSDLSQIATMIPTARWSIHWHDLITVTENDTIYVVRFLLQYRIDIVESSIHTIVSYSLLWLCCNIPLICVMQNHLSISQVVMNMHFEAAVILWHRLYFK